MSIQGVGLIEPVLQFVNGSGVPYAAGSIGFYAVGTLNAQNVYSDNALTVALPNPVPLNAAGITSTSTTGTPTPVYLQQATYDYYLYDANGLTVYGPITVSGAQWPGQVQGQAVLSPVANANGYTNRFTTTINKASTGTHALFTGTRFDTPTIGAGASTLTEATTVYIQGAPATGTSTYALHVAGGTTKLDGSVIVQGATLVADVALAEVRLTLTSGVPVTTSDVTAAATVYVTPYTGNLVGLYNGSIWNIYAVTELSIAVPASTGRNYDVFMYDNAGTPTLELSVAWNSDTTIFSSGPYATARPTQNGVYVKSTDGTVVDATRRYIGTFRTTGVSGQTEDSLAKRYVYTYVKRVTRALQRLETTTSWNYTTATIRQANASTANQVDVVVGVAEDPVAVSLNAAMTNANATIVSVGIGLDSTTAYTIGTAPSNTASYQLMLHCDLVSYPGLGRHYFSWNEWSTATGTSTWYGQNNTLTGVNFGLTGTWRA